MQVSTDDRSKFGDRQERRVLKRRWSLLMLAGGAAIGFVFLPALSACSAEDGPVATVVAAVGLDPYRLSSQGDKELSRFHKVFHTYAQDGDNSRQLKHFSDAFKRIQASYVDQVPEARLIDAAIKGVEAKEPQPRSMRATDVVEAALDSMTAALDPHSAYLNPEELKESELVTSGEFGGLGIQVTQEEGMIKVISPIEGTPADLAGLKPGDWITHLDGRPVKGMALKDAVNAMRGEPGSSIRLTIRRGDQAPFVVAITRAVIVIEPVRWRLESDVGYIRIVSFNEKVADRVEEAIEDLRARGGTSIQGLVLDMRNNPGGLLDQSLAVADWFLEDGVIVSIRGRNGNGSRSYTAGSGDLAKGLPIVALINAGSASAAEIVAGALQDHGRATVMGTPSFGKGSVQTVMRLPVEGALKLTTALYYTPSGAAIQARGVEPEIRLTGIDEGEAQSHEVDLPNALPAAPTGQQRAQATVEAASCPPVGEGDDPALGCAVAYLRAGSTDRFIAFVSGRPKL